ncbi:SDR family NAD(P)-dependent oxidoreductase [Actibacterium sp. 188UL27-1]|uniref:SDR family NAD(P)-dependent oxidoreductase n=1 Tax=Actibacterium sp. 188UL27-1 TaxID=2786961 RepID=UPI00195BFA46|nr:SDR family NAD(P)-dependent oxidoreductase [Actibacterium sp. 188UL27-1]MBM7066431.1 SDR family NAD(P)-dependent oxidoreductase [Actibacterium sp. 188UL27-1]
MERALIIGSSGGIGRALANALKARGIDVTGLSRSGDGLDVTLETSIAEHIGRLNGPFDLVLTVTGALEIDGQAPEKSIRHLSAQAMADQFALNTIGPALILKHAIPLIPRDGRAVMATLSARVGSIGDNALGGWTSYRTAKAAVNQVIHTTAIELARSHKQAVCVALHPGTVATPFTQKYLGRHPAVPPAEAAENLLAVIDKLTPAQTGQFFDWKGEQIQW